MDWVVEDEQAVQKEMVHKVKKDPNLQHGAYHGRIYPIGARAMVWKIVGRVEKLTERDIVWTMRETLENSGNSNGKFTTCFAVDGFKGFPVMDEKKQTQILFQFNIQKWWKIIKKWWKNVKKTLKSAIEIVLQKVVNIIKN